MLFHIGHHKTGTTFLQKRLFESSDCFIRVPQRKIFDEIIFPHQFEFKRKKARIFIDQYREAARQQSAVAVFSNERLSGGHHTGGHDCVELARRIEWCAPDACVLIFIREQRSMILSLYSQYIKSMGCVSLRDYCNPRYTTHNKELFNPVTLEYHHLIEEYKKRFERVLVLPYELIKIEPNQIWSELAGFLDITDIEKIPDLLSATPANVSRSPVIQRLDRVFLPFRSRKIPHVGQTFYSKTGHLAVSSLSKAIKALPLKKTNRKLRLSDQSFVEEFCSSRYEESNRKTSALINIDLECYGYAI